MADIHLNCRLCLKSSANHTHDLFRNVEGLPYAETIFELMGIVVIKLHVLGTRVPFINIICLFSDN